MKFDITKLPVGEMIIGFLLVALAVTFVGAFAAVGDDDDGGEPAVSATPGGETPAPTGDGNGGGNIAVSMGDNFFYPNEITLDAGASVMFDITNDGTAIHNMRIAGPDGKYSTSDDAVSDPQLVTGGGIATLDWEAPGDAGEIIFQCDFHPTDMKGTITVQ